MGSAEEMRMSSRALLAQAGQNSLLVTSDCHRYLNDGASYTVEIRPALHAGESFLVRAGSKLCPSSLPGHVKAASWERGQVPQVGMLDQACHTRVCRIHYWVSLNLRHSWIQLAYPALAPNPVLAIDFGPLQR